MIWLIYALSGLLLADFASGLIHWIIDRYCSPALPLAGTHFVALIHEHHRRPVAMFALGPVRNNAGFVVLISTVFAIFMAFGWLNPVTWFAFGFGACANQIHAWAHRRTGIARIIIPPLQRLGLLQSPAHHAMHHGLKPQSHYCLMTDYVNPLVDVIDLWARCEAALGVLGIQPKPFVMPNLTYRSAMQSQTSSNNRSGSSMFSFTRTRKVTASRPSTRR